MVGGEPFQEGKKGSGRGDEAAWWRLALFLFYRLSGWIVVPIVGAIYLGGFLDKKYQTDPWWFLGLSALGFVITCVGIVQESQAAIKRIEELNQKEKKEKRNDADRADLK